MMKRLLAPLSFLLLLTVFAPLAAWAQTTYTWTGAAPGDNLWTTPGNWSPNGVPGPTDEAIITQGTALAEAPVTVGTLRVGSASPVLGGTLGGSADVTVEGLLTWAGRGAFEGSGTVTAAGGASLELVTNFSGGQSLTLTGRTLRLGALGTVAFPSGDSGIRLNSGAILEVDGAFAASGPPDGTFTVLYNSGAEPLLRTTGAGGVSLDGGTLRLGAPFDIAGGPFEATAGELQILTGDTATTSAVTAAAGATVRFGGGAYTVAGPVTAEGTVAFTSGTHTLTGAVTGAGTVELTGGTVAMSGGTWGPDLAMVSDGRLNADAPLDVLRGADGGVVVAGAGGHVGGSADVTVEGLLTWAGRGAFEGSGTVTAAGGASLELVTNFSGGQSLTLTGRTLGSGRSARWRSRRGTQGSGSIAGPSSRSTGRSRRRGRPTARSPSSTTRARSRCCGRRARAGCRSTAARSASAHPSTLRAVPSRRRPANSRS